MDTFTYYSGEKGGHGKKVGRIRKACVFAVQAGIHQQPKPSNISTNIQPIQLKLGAQTLLTLFYHMLESRHYKSNPCIAMTWL
jgi:hypothetical protein